MVEQSGSAPINPVLPGWLSRGLADLFPAGTGAADPDQQLAARLAQAQAAGRDCVVFRALDRPGSLAETDWTSAARPT